MPEWLFLPLPAFAEENAAILLKSAERRRVNFREYMEKRRREEEERKHFEFISRYLKHTGVFDVP